MREVPVFTRLEDAASSVTQKLKISRLAVGALSGFLGSGKTTLLNRTLKEQHGHRIAVIENEFGEAGAWCSRACTC